VDFNIDLMQANTEQKALMKYLITDKGYTQKSKKYDLDTTFRWSKLYYCVYANNPDEHGGNNYSIL